jgi:hypothetical protein
MTTLLALIGVRALIYLYIWLLSAWLASHLSDRKGYGEKPGLATGVCLTFVAVIIWLIVPPRPDSKWRRFGPLGRTEKSRVTSG